jgi:hypothetical protein
MSEVRYLTCFTVLQIVTQKAEIKKPAIENNRMQLASHSRQPQKIPTIRLDKTNSFITAQNSTLWAGFSVRRSFSGSDYRAPNSLTDVFK